MVNIYVCIYKYMYIYIYVVNMYLLRGAYIRYCVRTVRYCAKPVHGNEVVVFCGRSSAKIREGKAN